jgi:hypothetical protein
MTRTNSTIDFSAQSDLVRMIEPLASYICATDKPRAALASALAVLFKEVEETNRTAIAHFGAFSEHR